MSNSHRYPPPPPLLLATRSRKARRASLCALCGSPVLVGQRIGLLTAGWAHANCIVQANRQLLPEDK